MKGLLEEKGKTSSMRFSFIMISIGVFIILLSLGIYIVMCAFKPELGEPKWQAIGIFAVGIAGVVTGTGYNKAQQKKIELENEKGNVVAN